MFDDEGNTYYVGGLSGSLTLGNHTLTSFGGTDVLVAKRSKAGEWEWMRSGGTANNDLGLAIDLDSNGNVFVTGYLGRVSCLVRLQDLTVAP